MHFYKSEKVIVQWDGNISPADAESLIGEKIAGVEAGEYSIKLLFEQGSSLTISASGLEGPPLKLEFDEGDILGLNAFIMNDSES